MKLLKFIFGIFNFIPKFDKEKKKYLKLGIFGKTLNVVFQVFLIAVALFLSWSTGWIIAQTSLDSWANAFIWIGGIFVGIIAVYFIIMCVENALMTAIVAFSCARSNKTVSDKVIEKVVDVTEKAAEIEVVEEDDKQNDKPKKSDKVLNIIFGVIHSLMLVGVLAGAVVLFIVAF